MKKLLFLFTGFIFITSCNQKDTSTTINDRTNDNLKGDVMQVKDTPYQTDSTGKMGAMDSCCVEVTHYDSAGYYIKFTSSDSKGNIKSEETVTHYDNGLFKEQIDSKDGKPASKVSIQLDKDGKKYFSAQEYDSAGKLKYFYKDVTQNDYNMITSLKQCKPDSTIKSSFESTFDKQHFTGQSSKDSSGKIISKSSVKLDEKGNQVEFVMSTTKMDSTTKKDSTTTKTTKYRYDTFDDIGNWTQRTEMDEKGKPTKIVKREITYNKK